MKDQRHKRKETFSVLMISNTDRSSRQFQISLLSLRLVFSALLVLLVVLILLAYQFFAGYRKRDDLQAQLASQKEQAKQLQAEVKELEKTIAQAEEKVQVKKMEATATTEPTKDATFPSLYPTHGSSVLKAGYSPEQAYISISTYAGSSAVATAQGTIVSISSDDTYKHIIEIQHEGGYTTRYMCQQEGEVAAVQGAQVQPGDVLINIITDSTQLDYQVIHDGAPVDPFMLIDAKG